MDEDAQIGSPVTLAELKTLGEFVRWQEITARDTSWNRFR